jgi:dienelactone hydrolase
MPPLSRRQFIAAGILSTTARSAPGRGGIDAPPVDVHQQLLELAARQEAARRTRFEAVRTKADVETLQKELRASLIRAIGELPEPGGIPPARITGTIDAGDHVVEKLVFESFPGYFVSALLYRPSKVVSPLPAVLSPCGHSTIGKAEATYQILHINLVKRGYIVLTYDPVGQGERSQFWDTEKGRSRFDLSCGEHAVLGNPLYLISSSLARYRIWDGLRALDYLTARPEVDAKRVGCVGNSGGGTLTAYIAALDPRVATAAICCYITSLRRRMGNRIQQDPSADPEQDLFGFISEGIDHAGLLALRVPRPTLLGTARFDFFSIEGARETYAEARRLFEAAGTLGRIDRVEAAERHGLTVPLRQAVYGWFERWLNDRRDPAAVQEIAVTPRSAKELQAAASGQVNLTFRSRPLLSLALEEFDGKPRPPREPLRDLLRLDPDLADPRMSEIHAGAREEKTVIVCVNGNEARDWREETAFLGELGRRGFAVWVVDPRGVGRMRPPLAIAMQDYADPLSGVEENIAYNAFLVGKSLVGMRVSDVLAAIRKLPGREGPRRIVACGRRDAALVCCMAAAVEASITHVAAEELRLSFRALFQGPGKAINAASIVPGLLDRFGDVPDVLAEITPRKLLIAAGVDGGARPISAARTLGQRFTGDSRLLTSWLDD